MKKLHFCYGHRLPGNSGKCSTLHGHNAVVEVHATPLATSENQNLAELNSQGMVIDFSVIKEKIGSWIDEHWDHTTILAEQDVETVQLLRQCPGVKNPFLLPGNPTAENLANYLLHVVCPRELKRTGIVVHKIVFWETDSCFAEESLDPYSESARNYYE
ncbi:MAG: 6-carboxytetrahydropterin synthase [Bdellovibrionales bacterium]|nr:6-carboxytetrahydropterin synthase [Bdellovibrionales bacterium]